MGPDIIAELEEMASVDEDLLAVLAPHFDPVTFQEVTSNPKTEEYRLDTEELRRWGVRATTIREQILEKAKFYLQDEEIDDKELMNRVMGTIFIVFGALKVVNLKGFAKIFAKYDLVSKHISIYGYLYPFISLI